MTWSSFIFRLLGVGLLPLIAGCTSMAASVAFDPASTNSGLACRSNLGAYSLPRRLIKVVVSKPASGDDKEQYGLEVKEADYVPDPHQIYCLDFLASRVADERIGIRRNNNNGLLLERVYTKSIDQTKENARKLIQGVADLAAFGKSQSLARDALISDQASGPVREFNIDPLVQSDMQKVNDALKPFGYCIYLRRGGDALVPDWSDRLCDVDAHGGWRPYKTVVAGEPKPSYSHIVDSRPVADEVRQRGIFYRPEVTHVLAIMKQDQPGIAGSPWHRDASMRLKLPNAAPPFLLTVERSFFTDAETDVQFNSGVMQSVSVNKKSELQAVSGLAVEVVQIVQKIPQVTLAIFDNTVENRLALINANQQLIKTLQDHNTARGLSAVSRRTLTPSTNALIAQGYVPVQRSAGDPDAMAQCLADPAIRQLPDPEARCREELEKGNF